MTLSHMARSLWHNLPNGAVIVGALLWVSAWGVVLSIRHIARAVWR